MEISYRTISRLDGSSTERTQAVIYRFEDSEIDTDRHEFRRAGVAMDLEPQVFGVLRYLIEHRDRLARKEELLAAVWGTTFVSDAALSTRIKQARQAVGDSGRQQRFIKTVHGLGYRFDGAVGGGPDSGDSPRAGQVRFCSTVDGVNIAFTTTGSGPPVVKVVNWLTHLEYDERSPVWSHFIGALSADFTLVRYDQRGCGLSDRELNDDAFLLEAWVRDLEAVVDALELQHFPLLGISQGGAIAIAYAVAHPERVSRLVLHGAYARGRAHRGPEQAEVNRALTALTREGWGDERSGFSQMFAARMIPRGTPEQVRWLAELQRLSASPQNAALIRQAFGAINVEELLRDIRMPTLVLHSRHEQMAPFEEGRRLAAGIQDTKFVPLSSDNHLVLEGEAAWNEMITAIMDFLHQQS